MKVAARQSPDPALRLAHRMLADRGSPEAGGPLYRENLATYLFHALGERGVEEVLAEEGPVTMDTVREHLPWTATDRWTRKLERDLASPYEDGEIFTNLERLEREFRTQVRRVREVAAGGPVEDSRPIPGLRFLVQGSLCKGRMGANSDIDARVVVPDADTRERLLQAMGSWPSSMVSIYPMPVDPGESRVEEILMGPRLDLGDGRRLLAEEGFLTRYYVGVLEGRGYRVEQGEDGRPAVTGRSRPGSRRRETGALAEKLYSLTHPSRSRQIGVLAENARRVGFSVLGRMLALPGLGAALEALLERAVPGRLDAAG